MKYWGKKRERLEEGLKGLISEGWGKHMSMGIHFGDFKTVITVAIEDLAQAAPLLRKHIEEFLPKTI